MRERLPFFTCSRTTVSLPFNPLFTLPRKNSPSATSSSLLMISVVTFRPDACGEITSQRLTGLCFW
ncbi:small COPII coat GTPase [Cryptococcus neoformans]|nr:small COPII coat GTPase [Cryptococcus neoformans var. grubii]